MRLQLALDMVDITEALRVLTETNQYVDIIEIGTPLALSEGKMALKKIKNKYPNCKVLYDAKIMDAGKFESDLAFDHGADIVTVLAAADDVTIKGAVRSAKRHGKEVMVDMIAIPNIKERAVEINNLGVNYICIHTAVDVYNSKDSSFRHKELATLIGSIDKYKLAVAGGVNPETIHELNEYSPGIVIVGSYITNSKDIRGAIREIDQAMNGADGTLEDDKSASFEVQPKAAEGDDMHDLIENILGEIRTCMQTIRQEDIDEVGRLIIHAPKIFIAGAGRSGLGCRGFAMRLMHMGFEAYVIGEMVTPSFSEGDLLIIGSGSGCTASLVEMAKKAKGKGGKVVLFTIDRNSVIAKIADLTMKLDAPTPKAENATGSVSIQPMGSLFEQSLFILFDSIIILLMKKMDIGETEMFARHANLE